MLTRRTNLGDTSAFTVPNWHQSALANGLSEIIACFGELI